VCWGATSASLVEMGLEWKFVLNASAFFFFGKENAHWSFFNVLFVFNIVLVMIFIFILFYLFSVQSLVKIWEQFGWVCPKRIRNCLWILCAERVDRISIQCCFSHPSKDALYGSLSRPAVATYLVNKLSNSVWWHFKPDCLFILEGMI